MALFLPCIFYSLANLPFTLFISNNLPTIESNLNSTALYIARLSQCMVLKVPLKWLEGGS